jgi:hypothetical protein
MYELGSSSDTFKQRSKSVFDVLENLEASHKQTEVVYAVQNRLNLSNDAEAEDELLKVNTIAVQCTNNSQDFEFKVPQIPSAVKTKNRTYVPGYEKNPEKWKKYSLEDVDSGQMSAVANRQAALSFLNSLKNGSSESETTMLDSGSSFSKLADNLDFNRPIGNKNFQVNQKMSLSDQEKRLLSNLVEVEDEVHEEEVNVSSKMETNQTEMRMFNRIKSAKKMNLRRKSCSSCSQDVNEEQEVDDEEKANSKSEFMTIEIDQENDEIEAVNNEDDENPESEFDQQF